METISFKKDDSQFIGEGLYNSSQMDKNFAPVMDYPDEMKVFDLSEGYDPEFIQSFDWGIGRYDEKRTNMYNAPQYEDRRNIHIAIDIWTAAHRPVFSFADGTIAYFQDNDRPGDYGPTVVTKHLLDDNPVFALYGHLSKESLNGLSVGQAVKQGEQIAVLGNDEVNGGWAPHLHFQLSINDPGEADMPGVVAEKDREQALSDYPDPRIVLGKLY